MRPVPRNIDRPNRNAEYICTYLVTYYGLMFLTNEPFLSIGSGALAVYFIYKLTLNKPEGMAFRLFYKRFGLGQMMPPARKAPRFEL